MPDLPSDQPRDLRPICDVAAERANRSEDPERFRACVAHAVTAVQKGADLATAWWDPVNPVRLAAEIEALAGLRRLRASRKDSK